MKKLITVLLLLPLMVMAQSSENPALSILPEVDGVPKYTEVINLDSSISQAELYNRARVWFIENYKSAKNVLQLEDKEAGILVGKGIIPILYDVRIFSKSKGDSFTMHQNLDVYHTIRVYTKKGRYKYEIEEINGKLNFEPLPDPLDMPIINRGYKGAPYLQIKMLQEVNKSILLTIESLKRGMQKPVTGKADW